MCTYPGKLAENKVTGYNPVGHILVDYFSLKITVNFY